MTGVDLKNTDSAIEQIATATDISTIMIIRTSTGTVVDYDTTQFSPKVYTETQTPAPSTRVSTITSPPSDSLLSFTTNLSMETENSSLLSSEDSYSLQTTVLSPVSQMSTNVHSAGTSSRSTEHVYPNTTVSNSSEAYMESNKQLTDTYAGTAAVASIGAASGSMVIGGAAYLILRRFACNKVSPTISDRYVANCKL